MSVKSTWSARTGPTRLGLPPVTPAIFARIFQEAWQQNTLLPYPNVSIQDLQDVYAFARRSPAVAGVWKRLCEKILDIDTLSTSDLAGVSGTVRSNIVAIFKSTRVKIPARRRTFTDSRNSIPKTAPSEVQHESEVLSSDAHELPLPLLSAAADNAPPLLDAAADVVSDDDMGNDDAEDDALPPLDAAANNASNDSVSSDDDDAADYAPPLLNAAADIVSDDDTENDDAEDDALPPLDAAANNESSASLSSDDDDAAALLLPDVVADIADIVSLDDREDDALPRRVFDNDASDEHILNDDASDDDAGDNALPPLDTADIVSLDVDDASEDHALEDDADDSPLPPVDGAADDASNDDVVRASPSSSDHPPSELSEGHTVPTERILVTSQLRGRKCRARR